MIRCANHLRFLIPSKERSKAVEKAIKALSKHNFDSIAFMGMSGALVAPTIASRMNKELLMVRKKDEKRHSSFDVEGYSISKRFVIVDDFVCSGETVTYILDQIKEFAPDSICIGILEINPLVRPGDYDFDDKNWHRNFSRVKGKLTKVPTEEMRRLYGDEWPKILGIKRNTRKPSKKVCK